MMNQAIITYYEILFEMPQIFPHLAFDYNVK